MVLVNPEHLKENHTLKGGTMSVSELFIKEFPHEGTVYITIEQAKRINCSLYLIFK